MIDYIIKLVKIPLQFLCHYFGCSSSGYYFWKTKTNSFTKKEDICKKIKDCFKKSKGTYGSPRIYRDLKDQGVLVSENTVARYMRELGLDARLKKKFRVQTTDSKHNHPIASRLFKVETEHCLPKSSGKLLAGDITYLRLGKSFLYLAVVLSLIHI